jgi:hypothetical protein
MYHHHKLLDLILLYCWNMFFFLVLCRIFCGWNVVDTSSADKRIKLQRMSLGILCRFTALCNTLCPFLQLPLFLVRCTIMFVIYSFTICHTPDSNGSLLFSPSNRKLKKTFAMPPCYSTFYKKIATKSWLYWTIYYHTGLCFYWCESHPHLLSLRIYIVVTNMCRKLKYTELRRTLMA